jgi:tetratricopeptide (TPR) repeat protein
MGAYEDSRGNLPAAIARYEVVAQKTSDVNMRVAACNNLGFDYRALGDMTKAKQYFTMALQSAPDSGRAMTGLGLVAEANGDLPEAIRQYSHALAVQPTDVGYLLLVQALRLQGRFAEANELFAHVAHSSPNLADAQKAAHDFLAGK